MKRLLIGIIALLVLIGCGQSYEETKRLSKAQRLKLWREDSAAFKIAVMPTLDCLPIYVAKERQMFDTVVDIRLKRFSAQMDCDTALMRGRVEVGITDLVRAERMIKLGTELNYFTTTNAYWLLITNRLQRMSALNHLDDKMVAMTRYSATAMLTDIAVDSAKLKSERVFRVQINDVGIRLKMLENNEMDALFLTEPQATQALLAKHKVLLDSRRLNLQLGAIVMQSKGMSSSERKRQMTVFQKGYNEACDSINKFGVRHYIKLCRKYYSVTDHTLNSLPDSLKFMHATEPRQQDIECARKWLSKQ